MSTHPDNTALTELLSSYDWRKNADISILPEHQTAVDYLLQTPADVTIMFRLGTCLMHRHKKPDMAVTVLEHALSLNTAELFNNLAYACNATGDTAKARDYLAESARLTRTSEEIGFATRIEGQVLFTEAEEETSYSNKVLKVTQGVEKCTQGLTGVTSQSEIARTYNRNAVELLKLARSAPASSRAVVAVARADAQIKMAIECWQNTGSDEFTEYKSRTNNTAQEISELMKARKVLSITSR